MKYDELKQILEDNLPFSFLNVDFSSKLALISLICYLYSKLKPKVPDMTYYSLVYKLGENKIPEGQIKGLSILCELFAYNCKDFITFDIEDKKIPAKIKEIMSEWLPF